MGVVGRRHPAQLLRDQSAERSWHAARERAEITNQKAAPAAARLMRSAD